MKSKDLKAKSHSHSTMLDRRRFTQASLSTLMLASTSLPVRAFCIKSKDKVTELVKAIARGDLQDVLRLLNQDPDLANAKDEQNRSMFVLAHLYRKPRIADLFLQRGISLDIVESVLAGNSERFIELAKKDPGSVNAIHPIGGNAYFAAAHSGRLDMIWPLNRWGASPNVSTFDPPQVSAFRAAFNHPNSDVAVSLATRMLVDAGDVSSAQPNRDSVLHGAATLGNPDLVKDVIRKGGDVDAKNRNGETPIAVARRLGHTAVVKVLAEHDEIDRQDDTGRFVYDVMGKDYQAPEKLDVPQLVINHFGEVCHYSLDEAKKIFKAYPGVIHGNASWNELGVEACAHMEQTDWTKYFLDQGAPMSLPTAIAVNESATAQRLLQENKNRIHMRGPHDFPLMWYPQIAGGIVDLADLLLNHGADINQAKQGTTCLHKAAYNGQIDLVKFLLDRGADTERIGKSDFSDLIGTPLDWAKARRRSKVIALLKQHRGDADEI